MQIVLFESNFLMGGRSSGHDRYRDWRLDVDNMSYEVCTFPRSMSSVLCFSCVHAYVDTRISYPWWGKQELLELGDRIGYVSTGLQEDEIGRCLRKSKLSILDELSSHLPTEMDWKCSICQVNLQLIGPSPIFIFFVLGSAFLLFSCC